MFKWILQTLGVLISLCVLCNLMDKDAIVSVFATVSLIVPELVMAVALWVCKGVSSAYKVKNPDYYSATVPVFGETTIRVSFLGYVLIFASCSILAGSFLGISVLALGITFLACFEWRMSLKNLFRKYLEVKV